MKVTGMGSRQLQMKPLQESGHLKNCHPTAIPIVTLTFGNALPKTQTSVVFLAKRSKLLRAILDMVQATLENKQKLILKPELVIRQIVRLNLNG
jgi:hypothetical protein